MANTPAPVSIERAFQTAMDTVWAAMTRREILGEWFREGIDVDVRPSGKILDGEGESGSVLSVEEPRSLVLAWGRPGEATARVSMTLSGEGVSASLKVELSEFADDAHRAKQAEFWHWAVDSLEAFLKSGFGIPYEPWRELQAELHRRAAAKSAAEAEAERRAAGVVLAPLAEAPPSAPAPGPAAEKKPVAARKKPARATKKPAKTARKSKAAAKKPVAKRPASKKPKSRGARRPRR